MRTYDHIILGTGQATGTLLGKLISTGDSVALIEGGKVGGSCVNYGCTPTKTLVASARAMHQARRGDFFGFQTGELQVDYARVRARMNEVRGNARESLTEWMKSTEQIDLIRGWGSFVDNHTVQVGDIQVRAKQIYINTGTRPAAPPITGLEDVSWMDSAALLNLERLPEHLLIIGGGYIGLEFAQVYRRLGCQVTVIQRSEEVMPREDADVAKSIRAVLAGEGVRFLLQADTKEASKQGDHIQLRVEVDGQRETLTGTDLLVATGRKPNSDQLKLSATGIKVNERGYIQVDDYCRTGVDGVFALGDVNGEGAFTHTSVNDAEIVLDYLFGDGNRKISDRIPIYALFTDPPLGRVGLTEKEALEKGHRVLKATRPMSEISRAKEMGETDGFAKLLVDADTDLIIGAAIHGPGGDEIINMFATIMHSKIPCRSYREVVLVHPTVSELMPFVLDGLELV